jgi:hypothetical protein
MKQLLSGIAVAALVASASPAWAQTGAPQSGAQDQSTQHNAPGSGGVSKPGAAGLPGSKSGPAARESSGSSTSGAGSAATSGSGTTSGPASSHPGPVSTSNPQHQDQAKVPGMSGNKSGPSAKEPGAGSSSAPSK